MDKKQEVWHGDCLELMKNIPFDILWDKKKPANFSLTYEIS